MDISKDGTHNNIAQIFWCNLVCKHPSFLGYLFCKCLSRVLFSWIGHKEREFIEYLAKNNKDKLDKKFSPNYQRVLKFRIIQKRKTLTDDLLLINPILDKLQAL